MQTALASSPAATQLRPWQQQPAQLTRCTVRLSHSLASRPVKSVPCQALVAQGPEDDSDSDSPADSFSVGAFTRELEARGVVQSRSQEAQEAESFDGQQLLEVLLEKYANAPHTPYSCCNDTGTCQYLPLWHCPWSHRCHHVQI